MILKNQHAKKGNFSANTGIYNLFLDIQDILVDFNFSLL